MTYDSNKKYFDEIICGSHTKDKTIRAQVLKKVLTQSCMIYLINI